MIDCATLSLRDAYDFAVMIEEDAQLRYQELAALLGDDAGGAGDVCRSMAEREAHHRKALVVRRARLFHGAPPRLEISALDASVEAPCIDDGLPRTGREALELALAAECRAQAFFGSCIPNLGDARTRALFEELMAEEAEHARFIAERIAALPADGSAARGVRPDPRACPAPTTYPDRDLLAEAIPRFDAATRAIAQGVVVAGRSPRDVADALGVSPRTVTARLSRFLELARRRVSATAALTVVGCALALPQAAAAPGVPPAPAPAPYAWQLRALPDRSDGATPVGAHPPRRAREHRAALARRVRAHVDARMPAEDPSVRRRLAQAILAEAERASLDPLLVLAVIHTESSFDPGAVSEAGARGLMQLLEPTMRREMERSGLPEADPHDPVANVRAGVRYLQRLVRVFGDLDAALMAYNAGPNRIRQHLRRGGIPDRFRVYPQRVRGELERLRVTLEAPAPGGPPRAVRGA